MEFFPAFEIGLLNGWIFMTIFFLLFVIVFKTCPKQFLDSSWTAVIVVVISIFFFHFRILGEEKRLTEQYGDSYLEYKKKVPRYFYFF